MRVLPERKSIRERYGNSREGRQNFFSPSEFSRQRGPAALTKHHQYADGGCLNQEPIGNNELAKAAGVSASTASAFFDEKFQGHANYKVMCRDVDKLTAALKLLNDEFAPFHLLGNFASNVVAPDEEDTDGR